MNALVEIISRTQGRIASRHRDQEAALRRRLRYRAARAARMQVIRLSDRDAEAQRGDIVSFDLRAFLGADYATMPIWRSLPDEVSRAS